MDPSFELLQTCVVPIFGKFNLHLCVKVISVCLLVWVHSRHLNEMTRQHKVAKIRLNFQLWRYQMDPLFLSWTNKPGIKFWQISWSKKCVELFSHESLPCSTAVNQRGWDIISKTRLFCQTFNFGAAKHNEESVADYWSSMIKILFFNLVSKTSNGIEIGATVWKWQPIFEGYPFLFFDVLEIPHSIWLTSELDWQLKHFSIFANSQKT